MFALLLVPHLTPNPTVAMSSLWSTSDGLRWTNRKSLPWRCLNANCPVDKISI